MSSDTPASPAAPAETPSTTTPADCARQLAQLFPALFSGPPKPLKLRIQADIQERAPGQFSKAVLSAYFRRLTGGTSYLVAISKATHRFDLDGKPSGELSQEHRQAAIDELARRRAKHQSIADQAQQARAERAALLRAFETTTLTPANFCALKGIAPQSLDALIATARREAQERHLQERHAPDRPGPKPHRPPQRDPRRRA